MTLKDCYELLEGNYEEVIGRLRSEALIRKFVMKYIDDKSYELLCDSLRANNAEEAFRAAHTIKGVCQNLGFTALYESSQRLTEALRGGRITEESLALFEKVKEDQKKTIGAIIELKNA